MKIGAVLMAVNTNKPLESYGISAVPGDISCAKTAVTRFLEAGITDIVVVTNGEADELKKELRYKGAIYLNAAENSGEVSLLKAVQLGTDALKDRCDKILYAPVELAFFSQKTIEAMSATQGHFVIPMHEGLPGHPFAVSDALFSTLLSYEGEMDINEMMKHFNISPVYTEVEGPGSENGDFTDPLQQSLTPMHPLVSVKIARASAFFGPGTAILLKQIHYLGSVREACTKTTISYSKGWSMIRGAEERLGVKLVERVAGGRNGGQSRLTPKALDLLNRFDVFEKRVRQSADEIFEDVFSGFMDE